MYYAAVIAANISRRPVEVKNLRDVDLFEDAVLSRGRTRTARVTSRLAV